MRPVLRQALSVSVATGAYGVSFGAVSVAAGLSVAQTCALSLLMFTGGSQFAYVGVLAAGGATPAAAATAVMLGTRNAFYGLHMSRQLAARGPRRLAAAHLTIDESTAVASSQGDLRDARTGFWATGASIYVLWNLMTLVGAVVGDALGDPRKYGFDAAASAAFLALLWPRLRDTTTRLVAVGGAAVATALTPAVPAGLPVLVAAAVAIVAGWRRP